MIKIETAVADNGFRHVEYLIKSCRGNIIVGGNPFGLVIKLIDKPQKIGASIPKKVLKEELEIYEEFLIDLVDTDVEAIIESFKKLTPEKHHLTLNMNYLDAHIQYEFDFEQFNQDSVDVYIRQLQAWLQNEQAGLHTKMREEYYANQREAEDATD